MKGIKKSKYINYAICASKETAKEWKEVINALNQKYIQEAPEIFLYDSEINESLLFLRKFKPKYTCFVVQTHEIYPLFYDNLHKLARSIDKDSIYAATIFGVLTGPDMETALRIASISSPLRIRTVLSGTKINLSAFEAGYIYSELVKGLNFHKTKTELKEIKDGPHDPIQTLVDHLNSNTIDLMVTSGHATEKDWNIGFSYPAGRFTLEKDSNILIGETLSKEKIRIESSNPKIYIGCGNCLIGNIKHPHSMALGWMKFGNAAQFAGYTVPTWFGYAGWGIMKYFLETAGLFSLSHAYFANLQTLNYLKKNQESNSIPNKKFYDGLNFDQNVFILYGDPGWNAFIDVENPQEFLPYKMKLEEVKPMTWQFSVFCQKDCFWECPIADDKNTIPGRPPFFIFPERFERKLKVIEGDLELTDLFVMMAVKGMSKKGTELKGTFIEVEE